jgi:DUF1680 family protein
MWRWRLPVCLLPRSPLFLALPESLEALLLFKVGAGLLDAHVLLGSGQALQVLRRLANYVLNWSDEIVKAHSEDYWFRNVMEYNVTAFGAESGGMNELAYNLYALTADQSYLRLASRFEHPEFQNAMLNKWDVLHQASVLSRHLFDECRKAVGAPQSPRSGV